MDVLKPELQYIDGICYRINSGNYSSNYDRGTPQPYIENDDMECVVDHVSDEEEFDVEVDRSGRVKTSFHVAKVYFPFIIGSKGLTRKRLETETRAKITVPKMGFDGDIVVTGADKKSVISARKRINLIVLSSRNKQPFTHFLSIPFIDPVFKNSFLKFKTEVLETCHDRGIEESIFQSEDKLHLTIGTLVLCDDIERNSAASILQKCKENVIDQLLDNRKLRLTMTGVEYMNDDPSEVDVLYGKVSSYNNPDLLQETADKIVSYFIQEGLMGKQYERVKLHVTLMNTVFRSPNGADERRKRETFDARTILSKFKSFEFGEAEFDRIDISLRYSTSKTGYYQSSATIVI